MQVETLQVSPARRLTQTGVTVDYEDIKGFTGVVTVTVTDLSVYTDGEVTVSLAPVNFAAASDNELLPDTVFAADTIKATLAVEKYHFAFNQGSCPPSAFEQADGNVLLLVLTAGIDPSNPAAAQRANATLTYTVTLTPAVLPPTGQDQVLTVTLAPEQAANGVSVTIPAPTGSGYLVFLPVSLTTAMEREDLSQQWQTQFALVNSPNGTGAFGTMRLITGHNVSPVSATKNYLRTPRPFVVGVNQGKTDGNVMPAVSGITPMTEVALAMLTRTPEVTLPTHAALTYRVAFNPA